MGVLSPADQCHPVSSTSIVRLAAASSVGTTLEWYDFTIYNVMAALVFNVVFFPSFDPLTGTLLAFSTYAVGYLARPAGGLFFGRLGDRRGRRFVLIATLVLMGVATSLIGILPTYRSWGILSPIALVMLRFVQGAAIGGEWAGAVLLSFEHGAPHRRGRNATARAPVKEAFRSHWRALLISIGVRVGPDVMYALLLVFTLTYVTTVLGSK